MEKDAAYRTNPLAKVSPRDVENLFTKMASDLHRKVDQTRDAYFGFIFPVTRTDFKAVARALDIDDQAARTLFRRGTEFSTFQPTGRVPGTITNHIVGASILALRGKQLDTGLGSVLDKNVIELVQENEEIVLEIAEARSSWFGRIFFPASAFSNAIAVFGGNVSPDAFYDLACKYGYGATAGDRRTVRGDFGIGVWLTLLSVAP